ncbi:MAG TPA: recombinase family protein, partial [Symbiobacteriaceae bacterium]|nr:recombinase family protein [Symbiobacteriaceae bacterium]
MLARGGAPAPGKVAAYIRWSTDEQGQGTTLAIQRERVELFIRSQGWSLAEDRVFVDDGYSGSTLDRPAMRLLREAVRAGEVDCVVVYKLDRLSRSLLDTVTLVRREWQERCTLYSATENFDTCSPVGQMVFNLLVSFAEFERNLIRERTLSGKRKRAQQGRNAGQRYAYGYRRGDDGGWVLDSVDETGGLAGPAAVVRQIFSRYM